MRWTLVTLLLWLGFSHIAEGQNFVAADDSVAERVRYYFQHDFSLKGYRPGVPVGVIHVMVDHARKVVRVVGNESLASAPFDGATLDSLQRVVTSLAYGGDYGVEFVDERGKSFADLLAGFLPGAPSKNLRQWKGNDVDLRPWVRNVSSPADFSSGLSGRHVCLWASHGIYYDGRGWKFQRPSLFGTCEDLFTQTFVVPYLIPMLERAGCVVFTPRERDWQINEFIVDNDETGNGKYVEQVPADGKEWENAPCAGFSDWKRPIVDLQNPFTHGTVRQCEATRRHGKNSSVRWIPDISEDGNYAVYVSYATIENGIDDAHYTVMHNGVATEFLVNQQMGGSTWVYLGTFYFEKNRPDRNYVLLTNESRRNGGWVTADAVRWGGGMGNVSRGGQVSGMPRFAEGARYSAQWYGMPYDVYSTKGGTDDYADDINVRSFTQNFLSGNSLYNPIPLGGGVPFEVSLAVHSDAGIRRNQIYGTLGICTTTGSDGRHTFNSGMPRETSLDFTRMIQDNICRDITKAMGEEWSRRELWDRNYSGTRNPEIPSSILEMFSHQNFADMKYGHDPHFKFVMARAIYKSILRYIYFYHQKKGYVVQPLPVKQFSVEFTSSPGVVNLRWRETPDSMELSASATGYIVYTKEGNKDFDNGTFVKNPMYQVSLKPGVIYAFKVSAVNEGGESFPSETLCAYLSTDTAAKRVLIVNGFDRLSGPALVETKDSLGFDLHQDIGVAYGRTAGFSGYQYNFNPQSKNWGASGDELSGQVFAGNSFNYTLEHGEALSRLSGYSFVSCQRDAMPDDMSKYDVVDLIEGAQRKNDYGLLNYKTFDKILQRRLAAYCKQGGKLLVSGAYIGSDMQDDPNFVQQILKFKYGGRVSAKSVIKGLEMDSIPFYDSPSSEHYAPASLDVLLPYEGSEPLLYTARQEVVGIGCRSPYRLFISALPVECIRGVNIRSNFMRKAMEYLFDN